LPTNLDESGRFCDAQLAAGRANKPMASPLAFGTAVDATSLNRDAPMTRMPNRSGREKDRDFDLPQQRLLDSFQGVLPGCLARLSWDQFGITSKDGFSFCIPPWSKLPHGLRITEGPAGFMIVCSCNVLSDHDVRSAVESAEDLPRSAKQIYGCLGCSAECGRCARTIKTIIDEALGACAEACCFGCPHSRTAAHQHDHGALALETVA
jgi:bacterioferritin-associated ferredoxin